MRNTTFNTKTLNKTLIAGALALAIIAPLQAQVLGGPVIATIGQIGGSVHGMGNIGVPDINPPSATPSVDVPHQVASKVAAGAAHATQAANLAKQANGSAATHALDGLATAKGAADANAMGGLTTATGATAGNAVSTGGAAVKGAASMGSSVAGAVDTTGTRDTAVGAVGELTRQARAGVSAAGSHARGTVNQAQHTAGKVSSSAMGSLHAARDATTAGLQSAHSAAAQAAGSASNTSSATAASSSSKNGQSNSGSPRKPGLLSPVNNSMNSKAATVDASGSGSASGNANTSAGRASGTSGSAHANGRAGARGSASDGISASA